MRSTQQPQSLKNKKKTAITKLVRTNRFTLEMMGRRVKLFFWSDK